MSSTRIGQAFASARASEFVEALAHVFGKPSADSAADYAHVTTFGWYRQAEGRSWLSAAVRTAAAAIFPKRLVILTWRLPIALRAAGCFVAGHDVHDDGYGTPESGCIDINCHRCGRSFGRTVLY